MQFAVRGLVAYKPVAYKKYKCISLHITLIIFIFTHFYNADFYELRNSFLNSLSKQFFFIISESRGKLEKHVLKIKNKNKLGSFL